MPGAGAGGGKSRTGGGAGVGAGHRHVQRRGQAGKAAGAGASGGGKQAAGAWKQPEARLPAPHPPSVPPPPPPWQAAETLATDTFARWVAPMKASSLGTTSSQAKATGHGPGTPPPRQGFPEPWPQGPPTPKGPPPSGGVHLAAMATHQPSRHTLPAARCSLCCSPPWLPSRPRAVRANLLRTKPTKRLPTPRRAVTTAPHGQRRASAQGDGASHAAARKP
jgi:hypothetical protein